MKKLQRRGFLVCLLSAFSISQLKSVLAAEAKVVDYKLGCFTRPWDAWDIETSLDGIAKAGFKYCGLMTAKVKGGTIITPTTTLDEARHIADLASKRNLKILCVYGEFGNLKPIENWKVYLQKLIDNTAACESPYLMLGGTGDKNLFDNYYKTVRESCDYAGAKKITIVLKPHGGTNATSEDLRKITDFVNKPNFKIWYDPGNIFYYSDAKIEPLNDVVLANGLIAGCSIKDYLYPKNVNVTPGDGMVNFPELFKKFKQLDFTSGPLLIECLARGDFDFVTKEAIRTKKYLEKIIQNL